MFTTGINTALRHRPLEGLRCGFSDFDFLLGSWKVRHRHLKRILSQCNSWEDFVGRSEARKILGGFGLIEDDILFEPHGTYRAMSLRTFDIAANRWSIWRYDGRAPACLEPPLQGIFEAGVGMFLGNCLLEGTSVAVRHIWTAQDNAPRFERAFSMNNGYTWETNWTMELCRVS